MNASSATQALDGLVTRTLEALDDEPMVFFLGAGASRAAPAFMPQPPMLQKAAFEAVAPAGASNDLPMIEDSLPEIYHEVLLDLGGESTREIWLALSAWESPQGTALSRLGIGPNLVHLLVVYLSWRTGSPVVTVNFDEMLERAAVELGLGVETSLGRPAAPGSVAIWKIHGSVSNLRSVRTTLQSITATDPDVLDTVKREFQRSSGCLIGYSGRDIDFFPFLCSWPAIGQVHWLSLNISKTAIQRFGRIFVPVDAPAEAWARRVIEAMPTTDEQARLLKQQLNRNPPSERAADTAYRSELRRLARRAYGKSFPPGHPKRTLAHATALAALGQNQRAEEWLDRYLSRSGPTEPLDCHAHILKSSLAHELARYAESREHAILARDLAQEHGLRSQGKVARLRIAEANRMLHVPPRIPIARRRELLRPRSLLTIGEMIVRAVTMHGLRRPGTPSPVLDYMNVRAEFEYLEHLVRIGAILQGFFERFLPRDAGEALFKRWWDRIERRSYAVGYTFGIGNAKKYRLRRIPVEERGEESLSVLELYELVPSPTGSAIHHRDVADLAAAQARRLGPGSKRLAKLREAVDRYERAIEDARGAGDPSLELKAMFGLRAVKSGRTWDERDVRDLLDRIESPAWERLAERTVAALV